MDIQDIRRFKVELLDDIHELVTDPVPDTEAVRQRVEAFFDRLEAESGKE